MIEYDRISILIKA